MALLARRPCSAGAKGFRSSREMLRSDGGSGELTGESVVDLPETQGVLREDFRVHHLDAGELQRLLDDHLVLEVLDPLEQVLVLLHALLQPHVDDFFQAGLERLVLRPLALEEDLLLALQLREEAPLPLAALLLLPRLEALLEQLGLLVLLALDELGEPEAVVEELDGVLREGHRDFLDLLLEAGLLGRVLPDDGLLDFLALLGQLVEDQLPAVVELVDLLLVDFLELVELLTPPRAGSAR